MNIQYKKGVLDLLVLSMLDKKDQYGYDISDTLSEKISLSPGTVYPILRKLKDDGYVTTYLSETSGGPARKYYKLTQSGKQKLLESKEEWIEFVSMTLEILEVKSNE
ncbi:MAG: PadR family transcriptional regulator [Firmicutes bacterium]|nr:PadR family transcriptional regulator [Bacillota bacterium]